MDKGVLMQYTAIEGEIKHLQEQMTRVRKEIDKLHIVSDSVKGTRQDGTYGSIRVTGYPTPAHYAKEAEIEAYRAKIDQAEIKLLETRNQAEDYIQSMRKSELRTMFRIFFLDGCNLVETAERLNEIYPKRDKKFTDLNVRARIRRFFFKM